MYGTSGQVQMEGELIQQSDLGGQSCFTCLQCGASARLKWLVLVPAQSLWSAITHEGAARTKRGQWVIQY